MILIEKHPCLAGGKLRTFVLRNVDIIEFPGWKKKKKKRPTYTVRKKSASPQLGLLTQGTKFMYGYHIFSKSLPPLNCCSSTLKTAHHAKMKWSSLTRSPCCSRWTQEFPKPFSKVTGTHLS